MHHPQLNRGLEWVNSTPCYTHYGGHDEETVRGAQSHPARVA